MRILRFRANNTVQYGVLDHSNMIRCMDGSPFESGRLTELEHSLDDVELLAPVVPPNILAIGLNYRLHAQESGAQLPDHPLLFLKATTAVTGPNAAIHLPNEAPDNVDYEAELAMVIGKTARHVPVDRALDYVLGFTCANDVSARDCQHRIDGQWARAKSFDTFCPLGPWIETELAPNSCDIVCRLNGTTMQSSTTADMIFHCAELVSYLSRNLTLLPGTVIVTGTPEGVGAARTPPVFLKPGDTVEVEIGGIGILRNTVTANGGR